jgi:hypothetical protein
LVVVLAFAGTTLGRYSDSNFKQRTLSLFVFGPCLTHHGQRIASELSHSRQIRAKHDGLDSWRDNEWVEWFMPYKIVATRGDEVLRSERESLLIAAAKARVWASVGWHVVVTDPDGKTVDPAEFERLFAPPDPRRAKLREVSARLRLAAAG